MNTHDRQEISEENVDIRKNKYDLTINDLRLKFREAFLSDQRCPEKLPRVATGAKKCCFH